MGDQRFISLATIIDPETLHSLGRENWQSISENVNVVSMMCYDLASASIKPAYSEFASNLYRVPDAPKMLSNANLSCDESIHYLQTLGVPAAKIVLGVPAYGVALGGVGAEHQGLFQPFNPEETPVFDDMGKGLLRYSTVLKLKKAGFNQYVTEVDGHVNGVWLYHFDKQQFVTFDNPDSIRVKVDYVLKNNLAGIMMWRIGQDAAITHKASLLRMIVDELLTTYQ